MELFKLFGSILVDSDAAENSISKTGDKADGLGQKLGAGIATAAKFGAALVAGAGAAGAGMLALVNKTANAADEIDKLSERTGINREELQRWKYAAGQSGADIGKLETGIKKLSDVMDEAANGNKKATEGFEKLGISMDDLKNKSQEEIFEETMKALADMEEGAERNALGNDLLGKSYTEMLPLLNAGSDGMQALKDRADELGIVMSEDAVKANVLYGDTMDDLKQSFGAVFMELSNNFLPVLQKLMDWALKNMPAIKDNIKGAMDGLGDAIKAVSGFFTSASSDLMNKFSPLLVTIRESVQNLFDSAQPIWESLKTLFQSLMPIIKPLAAFVAGVLVVSFGIAISVFSAVVSAIGPLINAFVNLAEFVVNVVKAIVAVLSGDFDSAMKYWEKATQASVNFFKSLWEGVKNFFVALVKTLIGFISSWGVDTEGIINKMKTAILNKFNELKINAVKRFLEIRNAIVNPINEARDKVSNAISKIKGFFANLKLKLPNIKTPKFKFSNWSPNPIDWVKNMPSIGIDWHAKGGVFSKPTLFETSSGIKGVGEAGPEAVLPLNESVLGMIGQKIADTMEQKYENGNRPVILQTFLDGKMIAEVIHNPMSQLMGNRNNLDSAMKGL